MCMYACRNGLRNYQTNMYMFKKAQGQYGNRAIVRE